jgi:hypothetical protein
MRQDIASEVFMVKNSFRNDPVTGGETRLMWGAQLRTTEQLELTIETLDGDDAERTAANPLTAAAIEARRATKPVRRTLAGHLLLKEILHPGACACRNAEAHCARSPRIKP